jgi:hypothetical protein
VIVTLDSKRRLTVPAGMMPVEPGDHFLVGFDAEEDALVYRRITRKANWLEVWKQCPVSMDDLPPRSREMPRKVKL